LNVSEVSLTAGNPSSGSEASTSLPTLLAFGSVNQMFPSGPAATEKASGTEYCVNVPTSLYLTILLENPVIQRFPSDPTARLVPVAGTE
jgi:hypothetical protein